MISLVIVSSAAEAARPDINAFLEHPVVSVNDLVHQVKTNPAVADRYERHFRMTKAQLLDYLSQLHRDHITVPKVYTVYSVPRGGRLKMHLERLKVGAPIFSNRDGKAILVVKCGNPLVLGPANGNPTPEGNPITGPDEELKLQTVPGVGSSGVDLPDMMLETPTVPGAMTYTPEVPETLSTPGLSPSAPEMFSGVGSSSSSPWGLGVLGGAVWAVGSSGHHSGSPTPEPASILLLGLGVVGVMRLKVNRPK